MERLFEVLPSPVSDAITTMETDILSGIGLVLPIIAVVAVGLIVFTFMLGRGKKHVK